MSKLRKFAEGKSCVLRFPGICNWNSETTVLAHLNCPDKGKGIKSPDWWGVHACSACHDELDGRTHKSGVDRDTLRLWAYESLYETQKRAIEAGLMG